MASEDDSSGTLTCNGTPVDELRVIDIKRELDDRGLSKSGSKTQLTERLKAQLLLEKLQQDAAQSSGDEGKVPNIAIQKDKAGQSEFVRQYLQQQQRNLERQMEVKKQVEDERKRKSADESSADESNPNEKTNVSTDEPAEVTSPKKFKDDVSNAQVAPVKDQTKITRPARKSSRGTSKAENGQGGEAVKDRSRSTTPEAENIRERTRSGSSSSERSPVAEKSRRGRRGRQPRGKATRGGARRAAVRKTSRRGGSSSPSSSPEEAMSRRKRRTTSASSRSRSRSPQLTSPEPPTRRSSRKASATLRYTPDHGNEAAEDKKDESPVQRRSSRRKASDAAVQEEPAQEEKKEKRRSNSNNADAEQKEVKTGSEKTEEPSESAEAGSKSITVKIAEDNSGQKITKPESDKEDETNVQDDHSKNDKDNNTHDKQEKGTEEKTKSLEPPAKSEAEKTAVEEKVEVTVNENVAPQPEVEKVKRKQDEVEEKVQEKIGTLEDKNTQKDGNSEVAMETDESPKKENVEVVAEKIGNVEEVAKNIEDVKEVVEKIENVEEVAEKIENVESIKAEIIPEKVNVDTNGNKNSKDVDVAVGESNGSRKQLDEESAAKVELNTSLKKENKADENHDMHQGEVNNSGKDKDADSTEKTGHPVEGEKLEGDGKKVSRLSRWKSRSKSGNKTPESAPSGMTPPHSNTMATAEPTMPNPEPEVKEKTDNVSLPQAVTDKNIVGPERSVPPKGRGRRRRRSKSSSSSSSSRSRSPPKKRNKSRSSSSSSRSRSKSRPSSDSSSDDNDAPRSHWKGKAAVPIASTTQSQLEKKVDTAEEKSAPVRDVSDSKSTETKAAEVTAGDVDVVKNNPPENKKEVADDSSMASSVNKSDVVAITDPESSMGAKGDGEDGDGATKKEKATKRRKWGSKTSKAAKVVRKPSTMEISSDSLKGLIGEVKMTETVFDLETEAVNTLDYDEQEEDLRDIKVKRTFIQASPKSTEAMEEDDPVVVEEDARRVEDTTRQGEASDNQGSMEGDARHVEPIDVDSQDKPVVAAVAPTSPGLLEKKVTKAGAKEGGKKKVKDKEGKKAKKKKDGSGAAAAASGKENKSADNKSEKAEPMKEKVVATHRPSKPLVPQADEPEQVSTSKAPARFPVSRVLKISGLVRPYTLGQLKELLKRTGELEDSLFWINSIKSECLAAYATEDDAVKTREALHGTRWPLSNPKILDVDFATVEEVKHRQGGGVGPVPTSRQPPKEEPEKPRPRDVRDPEQDRRKEREQRDMEREKEREKRDQERQKRREAERKNPVREWDRDKVQQASRSRSRSKGREEDRSRRSRERGREKEDRKRRERSRDDEKKKEKKQKADEEPPAKLLDDLFRKTKATPCIYWLPLTEEQAKLRETQREEKEKERQKRLAAIEERHKEEEKKREAARQERIREREKERNRERERMREREKERDRERDRDRGRRRDRSSRSESSSRSRSRRRR